jgi:plasmid stabilization system protein ParE
VTYRVEVTEQAQADAEAAYEWIVEHRSREQGERWYRGLLRQIATLSKSPLRCPLAGESDKFPHKLRVLLYGKRGNKYRVIFTVENDTAVVLFVHHSARDELQP